MATFFLFSRQQESAMFARAAKYSIVLLLVCLVFLPAVGLAQGPPIISLGSKNPGSSAAGAVPLGDLEIFVRGLNGAPIDGMVVVTLSSAKGGVYQQATAMAGHVQFHGVAPSRYTVQAVASGFENAVQEFDATGVGTTMVNVEMRPISVAVSGFPILTPKAQKELGKALDALRANKPADARGHLDAAQRLAPNHPEVNYLFGIYWEQLGDWVQTKSSFAKAIDAYPKYARALLSLSEVLLHENKPAEALTYLNRSVEAEPSAWGTHALLADAYFRMGAFNKAIEHAERALELGHGQAALVQPLLARALAERGDKDRATSVLERYLKDYPGDAKARKQLESLKTPQVAVSLNDAGSAPLNIEPLVMAETAAVLPPASIWLPPSVDEKVPPVEPGAVCALNEVVRKAGNQVREFIRNVDRFTATESLVHESIDKWGLASSPEKRKFDYVVSIGEVRPGLLNVQEYRHSGSSQAEFPDGVITNGLPSLVLIFHPYNVGSFELTCEGLARWNGGLAWQVHFRQRPDKPNNVRSYKVGLNGSSYPIALKGRAWIEADNYQVVRLETDLVAPMPEIRLAADHTAIEYGPVNFRERKVDMWLPQSAEVYYDWRGRRIHRRHSFSQYLLFSVDDQQRIFAPKSEDPAFPSTPADPTKPSR
jgi:tetratricopeptide (TPR) repeat protein